MSVERIIKLLRDLRTRGDNNAANATPAAISINAIKVSKVKISSILFFNNIYKRRPEEAA